MRVEHYKVSQTKITPGQGPGEFACIMNSCWNRLNASTPPEALTDWQYENILLQALSPHHKCIRSAHLKRRNFGLANIQRMMAAICADNFSRGGIISADIVGPGAAMKAMDSYLSDVQCHNCSMFSHYRRKCPNRHKQQY